MSPSFHQLSGQKRSSQLDEFTDFQILSFAFANDLTAFALKATVKAKGQGIIEFKDAVEQIFHDLQPAIG
jgi:hypothetical protein